jgi:signal transduction histidine kinase
MDREPSPDVDPLTVWPALTELCRAVASLCDRLDRSERAAAQAAPMARDPGSTEADADQRALGIVQELLSIPPAGLAPSDLFTLAMERASRLLGADRAMFFAAEADRSLLVPRAAHGFRKEDLESTSVRPGEGIVGRAFREERVLPYPGASGEPLDPFFQRFPVRDAIAVPVRAEGAVVGVLYVGRRRVGVPFSGSDILLLLVIADRVGGGLIHQARVDRQARQTARLEELRRYANRLLAARPLDDRLAAACEAACRIVDVPAAAVAIEAGHGDLVVVASRGLPARGGATERVNARSGLTGELYASEAAVACRDVQARRTLERSFLGDGGFRGCLLVALAFEKEAPTGVLYLADTRARDFEDEEIEAARLLAAMTTWALRHGRGGHAPGEAAEGSVGADRTAQMERAQALGEMASGLSRELSNIFATILGKSRLLLARTNSDPLREGLATVEEAAWRGADVVHRLLALAGPASDEPAGPVDMAALARDVIALTRPRWSGEEGEPGAAIDVVPDLRSAPPVRGSETALREMLVNLVMNAVDAMPAGGRLTLSTRLVEGGVELAVEDTGEGIAEEVRGRVFDAFFTTRSPKRMGLGLTVAQGVIVRHGGFIEISGAPHHGTRVTVWLPGATPAAAASNPVLTSLS